MPEVPTDHVGETTEDTYRSAQERTLSEAVLQAIERHTDSDRVMKEFVLYEDVDPDALDTLFRPDADANTIVQFDTDGVRVQLWGDSGVEIRVMDREGDLFA